MPHLFLSIWYRIAYLTLRSVLFFFANIPIPISRFIAYCVGTIFWFFAGKRRKKIQENLQIAYPEGIPFPIKRFTHQVFVHFAYTFFEFALGQRLFQKDNWQKYVAGDDIESLRKELSQYPCAVLCTGHLGNFTLIGHVVCYSGIPAMTVIRELYNPLINNFFMELLSKSGNHIVLKEKAYETFQQIIPQGICPGVLIDQYAGKKSLYVPFMGKKAYTAASPASLARKYELPIYFVALVRESFFRFRFFSRKVPIESFTQDKQKDLESITTNLNQVLEEIIRLYPEQWFWMHRRWRD